MSLIKMMEGEELFRFEKATKKMRRRDKTDGLGAIIKYMRKHAVMTQDELANKVKLNRSSIANMENGNQTVLIPTFKKIADVCGFDLKLSIKPRPSNDR